ncbi:hypothetical protein DFJ43DRAFT_1098842 [Lentinula guzmanii]|uniref:Uncharacterized protein n=2 Tax=Lentinula TaxID=5352 RepID=A0AA38J3P2_9AGAR|nr:hypothetical protein DFJ43DRAFT_1098842 [Lentinula guzmanii]KAJ3788149.1 hypothetical protein GGU10DRAFT_346832 [Lentinula aff. detonsa]KAJ3800363.1 hypothetical protein GGU11DRAFT_773417 [Lentinula aff. detonsa]
MFTKSLCATLALVGFALAQSCPEALRFGGLTITPQPIVLGQEITFEANFTCAIELGYAPVYTDYTLVVPASNNSGFQPPVYFARRDGPASGIDKFTVTFDPTYSPFVVYPDAQYDIVLASTHAASNDSYGTTLTTGSISYGVSITQASD